MSEKINKRLKACASFIRRGAILADVGTDHAYLPLYLLSEGVIDFAYLSDINEGPLAKAKENAEASGFSAKVSLKLSDGAGALSGLGITDYAICGMGGELIADIIDRAPQLKDGEIRLALQPMSKPEALRKYLFDSGFEIERELYVTDEGKHYVCMLAAFSGRTRSYTDADIHFGREEAFFAAAGDDFLLYMNDRLRSLSKIISGKLSGGLSADSELMLKDALEKRLKAIEEK